MVGNDTRMRVLTDYERGKAFDEVVDGQGEVREHYHSLMASCEDLSSGRLARRQRAAELFFLHRGTTFTVYSEKAGIDRVFPFDSVPRIVPAAEWALIERGLKQ